MGAFRTNLRLAAPAIALLLPLATVGQTVEENHERITALEAAVAANAASISTNIRAIGAVGMGGLASAIADNSAYIDNNATNIRHNANAIAANMNYIGSNASAISDNRNLIEGAGTGGTTDAEIVEAIRYIRAQFDALGDVSDTPGTWTMYWLQDGGCDPVDVYFPNREAPAEIRTHIRLPAGHWKSVKGSVLLCQIDLYPNGRWSAASEAAIRVWATHETGIALWWPVDPDDE